MTSWLKMTAIEFDATVAADRKARQVVATAGQTLFPRLLPEARRKTSTTAEQLPGQADLFGEDQ